MKNIYLLVIILVASNSCQNDLKQNNHFVKVFNEFDKLINAEKHLLYSNNFAKCYMLDSIFKNVSKYRRVLEDNLYRINTEEIKETFLIERIIIPKNENVVEFAYRTYFYFNDSTEKTIYNFEIRNLNDCSKLKKCKLNKAKDNIDEIINTNFKFDRKRIYKNFSCDNFLEGIISEDFLIITKINKKQQFSVIFIDDRTHSNFNILNKKADIDKLLFNAEALYLIFNFQNIMW